MLIVMGRPLASLTTSTNSRPLNEPAATRRATRMKSVSACGASASASASASDAAAASTRAAASRFRRPRPRLRRPASPACRSAPPPPPPPPPPPAASSAGGHWGGGVAPLQSSWPSAPCHLRCARALRARRERGRMSRVLGAA